MHCVWSGYKNRKFTYRKWQFFQSSLCCVFRFFFFLFSLVSAALHARTHHYATSECCLFNGLSNTIWSPFRRRLILAGKKKEIIHIPHKNTVWYSFCVVLFTPKMICFFLPFSLSFSHWMISVVYGLFCSFDFDCFCLFFFFSFIGEIDHVLEIIYKQIHKWSIILLGLKNKIRTKNGKFTQFP